MTKRVAKNDTRTTVDGTEAKGGTFAPDTKPTHQGALWADPNARVREGLANVADRLALLIVDDFDEDAIDVTRLSDRHYILDEFAETTPEHDNREDLEAAVRDILDEESIFTCTKDGDVWGEGEVKASDFQEAAQNEDAIREIVAVLAPPTGLEKFAKELFDKAQTYGSLSVERMLADFRAQVIAEAFAAPPTPEMIAAGGSYGPETGHKPAWLGGKRVCACGRMPDDSTQAWRDHQAIVTYELMQAARA